MAGRNREKLAHVRGELSSVDAEVSPQLLQSESYCHMCTAPAHFDHSSWFKVLQSNATCLSNLLAIAIDRHQGGMACSKGTVHVYAC